MITVKKDGNHLGLLTTKEHNSRGVLPYSNFFPKAIEIEQV